MIRPPPHPRHIQKSKPQGKLPTTPGGRAFDGHCVRMEVTSGSQARHEESSPVIHTCPGMKREPALGGKIADRPLVRPISSSIRPKPMARQMQTAVTVLPMSGKQSAADRFVGPPPLPMPPLNGSPRGRNRNLLTLSLWIPYPSTAHPRSLSCADPTPTSWPDTTGDRTRTPPRGKESGVE